MTFQAKSDHVRGLKLSSNSTRFPEQPPLYCCGGRLPTAVFGFGTSSSDVIFFKTVLDAHSFDSLNLAGTGRTSFQ